MDALRDFLDEIKKQGLAEGNLLGLLRLLIGQRVETAGGELISAGLTWRVLADLLKKVRWNPEAVRELGIDPAELSPRDRGRFWYQAIARARVDSPEAEARAEELAQKLRARSFQVK